jgi:ABC-2 type transport system ATP-binding protein
VSTHTLELAEVLCDELAVIDRGRITASGSLAELRRAAETEDAGLEEIFLKITRGAVESEITAVLEDLA